MNHNMRLAIFSKFSPLKLLAVADTRFASIIVMLKRLKLIKRGLEAMAISEEWSTYRKDDVGKASFVKKKILSDDWWEQVSYIIDFTRPIYEMIRLGPHRDPDVSSERMKCFRRLFPSIDDHLKVMDEYALFSMKTGPFEDLTCISVMFTMESKKWWANFGVQTPFLQTLAFKLLGQPSSSSCAERNWSTCSFIHSLRMNKLNPSRAQDLVFIHNNLRFLSRNSDQYDEEKTKMWDVGGDDFDSMKYIGYLEFASLSLDEPDLENGLIID
ncbi:hypothetical protein Bca4012_072666 [Brassica carinata]